eukprot:TRINITY_DN18710_c0_g1_i1.p1 TRINITY_DN18710_c0_g1~~TRINITY_DN18710_c0_g1_i1.p1  ORF type:complete len:636 (+),score=112.19 TRINITY_DN18710_c0_g1_i1:98-2005(+)
MSFINFLRTGRRSSKNLKTTKKLTRLELFERSWDSLRMCFEASNNSVEGLLQKIRTDGGEMVNLLISETDTQNSTPPCYECLLSKDVIKKLCKYSRGISKKKVPVLHAAVLLISDIILAAGSEDRPLLGHHSQVILPATEVIKYLLPELGCIPGINNQQDPRLHHSFLYLLYSLAWQLSSSPECTGFFIDSDTNESLLVHAIPYIGSDGFVNSRDIDPSLEYKDLFLSDLAIEVVERLTVVWYPECVSFLDDISPLLASSAVKELGGLLEIKPPKLVNSPEMLERVAIRLQFLSSVELFSLSPTLHSSILSHFRDRIVAYFETFFERGLVPSSAAIACMRFVITRLKGRSFYEPICNIFLSKIDTLASMLSATDSRSLQLLLLLSVVVQKCPGSCQILLGQFTPGSGKKLTMSTLDISKLFNKGLVREENNRIAHRDASAEYRKPEAPTAINSRQEVQPAPENGVFPAVVNIVKRSVQVELLVAVFCFLSSAIRTGCSDLLTLLFDEQRGLLASTLTSITKDIDLFISKHGASRVRHLALQARRELGILGGSDKRSDPSDLLFCKWVIVEEWRAELHAILTAHREAQLLSRMGQKVSVAERAQPPPLFLPVSGTAGGSPNSLVVKHPRDNPIKVS